MARPSVSVVVPFAGAPAAAAPVFRTLRGLHVRPGDELILVDNSGGVGPAEGVTVVPALGERSPAHARNAGGARAAAEWILFLDADCDAPADLLERYFSPPPAWDVGALAGEVIASPAGDTLAARYGAARNFLAQRAHLAHPYLPRAVAANLLVRREAFGELGGFFEGVRAAEDTDFSWRLQRAGWRLELRPQARVEHHYRTSIGELRRQWRGYAAGRAWLSRRYHDFTPEPAARRVLTLRRRRIAAPQKAPRPRQPHAFLAVDALLALEELAGFTLSNKPPAEPPHHDRAAAVVLVADRFPAPDDPHVEFAHTLKAARVEAVGRPRVASSPVGAALKVDYMEDDGLMAKTAAALWLLARHPLKSARDIVGARSDEVSFFTLAPAATRLERDGDVRLRPLGGGRTRALAQRLAALAAGRVDE